MGIAVTCSTANDVVARSAGAGGFVERVQAFASNDTATEFPILKYFMNPRDAINYFDTP